MNTTNSPRSQAVSQLRFGTKFFYGIGETGAAITTNIRAFFLLFFLTQVAGLDAGLAGTVLLLGRLWDTINDPLIGWLSDRTRSRWGRRHPWMLWGALPFGVFFGMQWLVPAVNGNQWILFAYCTGIALLGDTAFTAVTLPYDALVPDLSEDYHERTSLISFKSGFTLAAGIAALVIAQVIFAQVRDPIRKYWIMGLICAVLSVLPIYLCIWGTRKRLVAMQKHSSLEQPPASQPLWTQIQIVFRNRPFLLLMGLYLCVWTGTQMMATIVPYYVVQWMGLPDQHFTQAAIAVQVTALFLIPVWQFISHKVGKKMVLFLGLPLWMIAMLGLFLLQPGQVAGMYALAMLAGVGISTVYIAPWSMLPDVIDFDELQSGERREGIFYGFIAQGLKLGIALALFLVGKSLDWAGLIPTVAGQGVPTQPESVLWVIRLIMGPITAGLVLGGLLFAHYYPISREVHAEILLKLAERKS